MCTDCKTPVDIAVTPGMYIVLPNAGCESDVHETLLATGGRQAEWTILSDDFTVFFLPQGWNIVESDHNRDLYDPVSVQRLKQWVMVIDQFGFPRLHVRLVIDKNGAYGYAAIVPVPKLKLILRCTRRTVRRPAAVLATLFSGTVITLVRGLIFTHS